MKVTGYDPEVVAALWANCNADTDSIQGNLEKIKASWSACEKACENVPAIPQTLSIIEKALQCVGELRDFVATATRLTTEYNEQIGDVQSDLKLD